jgi:hypothetical protein
MNRLYIAYGSNLNLRQMASRCPSATVFSPGVLNNWELLYRGGVATIRRKKGSVVPVGLWMIDDRSERSLDRYEGYPYLYVKENIYAVLPDGSKRKGMVYIMQEGRRPAYPSSSYETTIREGYKDFGLDIDIFEESLIVCMEELSRYPLF